MLSNFQPNDNATEKYGVYRKDDGVAEIAFFIVYKDGIIRYSDVSPICVNQGRWNFEGFRSSSSRSKTIGGK